MIGSGSSLSNVRRGVNDPNPFPEGSPLRATYNLASERQQATQWFRESQKQKSPIKLPARGTEEKLNALTQLNFSKDMLRRAGGGESSGRSDISSASSSALQNSPGMEAIVEDLRQTSIQFETITKQVAGFRKGLGGTLSRINAGYMSAFERMLSEFAKLQKKKSRKQGKRILEQDKIIADLDKDNRELRALVQRLEITVQSQESILAANKTTIGDLDDDLQRCRADAELAARVGLGLEDRSVLEKHLRNSIGPIAND
jgi:hypothetical protein